MQISNRFSVAVHILLCVDAFSDSQKMTSDILAGSVGVNPVVIRRTLGSLKKAGLVDVAAGTGGSKLARPSSDITLLDIYLAVEPVEGGRLFSIHNRPNPQCPVGSAINPLLERRMRQAQKALEDELAGVTLHELLQDMNDNGSASCSTSFSD